MYHYDLKINAFTYLLATLAVKLQLRVPSNCSELVALHFKTLILK